MKKALNAFAFFVILVVVGFYFYTLFKYWENIPFNDDIEVFIFLNDFFSDSADFKRNIFLFIMQSNEHRTIFNKLIYLLFFDVFHYIDFRHYMFVGNIGLVGIGAVLYKMFSVKNYKLILFLPVIFLLFQFRFSELTFWGIASIQFFWVTLFVLLSLYYLFSEKQKLSLAILFAIFATFTNGNGMFIFFVGLFGLLFFKRKKDSIKWLITATASIALYFIPYIKPPGHPSLFEIFNDPINSIVYFLYTIAQSISFNMNFMIFIGLLTILFFIFLTYKKYYLKNPAVYSMLLFLFLNSAILTVARSGFGAGQALSPRYSLWSILFFILIYIAFVELVYKYGFLLKRFKNTLSVLFVFILCFSAYYNYSIYTHFDDYIKSHQADLRYGMYENRGALFPQPLSMFFLEVMQDSIDKGIYIVPEKE